MGWGGGGGGGGGSQTPHWKDDKINHGKRKGTAWGTGTHQTYQRVKTTKEKREEKKQWPIA